MKVSYKKIRRRTPVIVDHYYSLTLADFFDDDECSEMLSHHIRDVIRRGQKLRAAREV